MNTNPSMKSKQSPSASTKNQNPPNNAPRISLRDALLQQINPTQPAEAEDDSYDYVRATLAGHPEYEPPTPPDSSPQASRIPGYHSSYTEAIAPELPSDHERHSRKCKICNSPDREDIDQAYIHWVPLHRIVREYGDVSSSVSLYRHALATGLFSRRRSRFQHVLDRIIEQAGDTRPSADAVLRAIRASSLLNENGRWDEPTRRVIIEHHVISSTAPSNITPSLLDASVTRDILEASSNENRPRSDRPNTNRRPARKEAP